MSHKRDGRLKLVNMHLNSFYNHYENMPMQYKEIFKVVKNENFPLKNFDIFLIFAQNIDCGYTLEPPRRVPTIYVLEAVLTSTHNLCFGAKIRKIGIPLQTPVLLYTDTNNTSQPTWSILSR